MILLVILKVQSSAVRGPSEFLPAIILMRSMMSSGKVALRSGALSSARRLGHLFGRASGIWLMKTGVGGIGFPSASIAWVLGVIAEATIFFCSSPCPPIFSSSPGAWETSSFFLIVFFAGIFPGFVSLLSGGFFFSFRSSLFCLEGSCGRRTSVGAKSRIICSDVGFSPVTLV